MSFVQIRGAQIQDKSIGNHHIDPTDPIQETNLSINFHNHTEALEDRKIVVPVQVNGLTFVGASIDVTSNLAGNIVALSANTVEGVITDAPNNKVEIRNADETSVYLTVGGAQFEVYGRVTSNNAATPTFSLGFFYLDGTGTEQPANIPAQATPPTNQVAFFPKRYNLHTMDEMVLAGYRFMVQDAVDAVTGANVNQLAADLYGPNYSLTGNGVSKLSRSVVAEIQYQTSGISNTAVRANTIIDEVVTARASYQNLNGRFANIENNVSTNATNISSLQTEADNTKTEVTDARTNAASTPVTYATLKARLDAIDSNIATVSGGGSTTQTEINAARVTSVAQQTGAYITEASLEDRLTADFQAVVDKITGFENDLANSSDRTKGAALVGFTSAKVSGATVLAAIEALSDRELADTHGTTNTTVSASSVIDEIVTARGSKASLEARLTVAINEDGTLKAGKQIHDHKKYVFQATGGETSVYLPNGQHFQYGDDTLDLYINGALQSKGLNYTELQPSTPDGTGIGVTFGSSTLLSGDVVTFRYILNNAQ